MSGLRYLKFALAYVFLARFKGYSCLRFRRMPGVPLEAKRTEAGDSTGCGPARVCIFERFFSGSRYCWQKVAVLWHGLSKPSRGPNDLIRSLGFMRTEVSA